MGQATEKFVLDALLITPALEIPADVAEALYPPTFLPFWEHLVSKLPVRQRSNVTPEVLSALIRESASAADFMASCDTLKEMAILQEGAQQVVQQRVMLPPHLAGSIKTVDLAQDAYQQEYTSRGGLYGLGPKLQSRARRGNQSFVYYEKDLMNGLNAPLVQPEIQDSLFKQQLLSQLEAEQLRL